MDPRKVYIETVGCQMNVLDSELVIGALKRQGYTLSDTPAGAGVLLFNTCSIRDLAEEKAYSALGRVAKLKAAHPDTVIGVLGCMAQKEQHAIRKRAPYVDLVVGTGQLAQVPSLVAKVRDTREPQYALSLGRADGGRGEVEASFESYDPTRDAAMRPTPYQAYVRIQIGCDKFCTYCVVPGTRGPEQSREPGHLKREVELLVEQGAREVTLLGQTVNSYVYKHGDGRRTRFSDLLRDLSAVPGLDRLKFVTNYPKDMTDDVLEAVRDLPKVAKYLHVPVQSGCDDVLKRMKRGYTVTQYREMLHRVREALPGAALSSDFIVGFCGETDESFEKSVELCKEGRFKNSFIFKYSQRGGTKAAERYPDDIPDAVKKLRNNALLEVQNAVSLEDHRSWIGKRVEVLVEGPSRHGVRETGPIRQLTGRTPTDHIAVFDAPDALCGELVEVDVTDASGFTLYGDVVGANTTRAGGVNPPRRADAPARQESAGRAEPRLMLTASDRVQRNRAALAAHAGPLADALDAALTAVLPASADPDLALNALETLLATPAARERLPDLLADRGRGLDALLQLLGVSQFFADTLTAYPEAFDLVRTPAAGSESTAELTARLRADVDAAANDAGVLRAFRRFRHLRMLTIGANDVLRSRPLEEVTRDLARSADAAIEVAVHVAQRTVSRKHGRPMAGDAPARLAALAFGKLGGEELNYSSDIDLMFLYDRDGKTTSRAAPLTNADYYARVVGEVTRLLSSHTDRGFAYRVDLRLRPDGARGPLARSVGGTLSYYDVRGRTWERQALIKLRPVGGDPALGREFLTAIEPFVYRKYFSFSEINEVKALKRRMEARSTQSGADELDVKTGRGGIRDIEYTVQFLQLLNGGDLPAVRQRNTLLGLEALEIAGCLTGPETYTLSDAYRFLRKTEHRLQLLFDWQTHKLPTSTDELAKLARRMGYTPAEPPQPVHDTPRETPGLHAQRRSPLDEAPGNPLDARLLLIDPLDQFLKDYHDKTRLDRAILNHLLHQTFTDARGEDEPESDLILVQDPDEATVRSVLGRYPFRDVPGAYQNLARLAQEEVPYLSHRRCRHFLASIAPPLLRAVAATPDPDRTLNEFERVTASLGGKAVLYELFSFNPASLKLVVDICSTSPYLCAILVNNPGMLDELMDTLVLDQRRTPDELRAELTELLRGASDLDPILHSFQDKELLRVGVRDVLGKDDLRETTAAISDIATTLLNGVFDAAEAHVTAKHGTPFTATGTPCDYAVLALGKLGGREIGYHSDLDLLILYEGDGQTRADTPGARPTTNFQYFTQLAQRGIRQLGEAGPLGRLYHVDMRLRPTGQGGSLVVPLAEFRRYTDVTGTCRIWERQSLARARVVRGIGPFAAVATAAVRDAVTGKPWCAAAVDEIEGMRAKMEPPSGVLNVKRSPGGLVDIEFLVQLHQLRHGRGCPDILEPNIPAALAALAAAGCLPGATAATLRESYLFLRSAELRLRVVTDRATNEVPEASGDRVKLAGRMGFASVPAMFAELTRVMTGVRELFREELARGRR